MIAPTTIHVVCPHCGFKNVLPNDPDLDTVYPNLVICDSEEGGCDAPFAFDASVHVSIRTYTLQLRDTATALPQRVSVAPESDGTLLYAAKR